MAHPRPAGRMTALEAACTLIAMTPLFLMIAGVVYLFGAITLGALDSGSPVVPAQAQL